MRCRRHCLVVSKGRLEFIAGLQLSFCRGFFSSSPSLQASPCNALRYSIGIPADCNLLLLLLLLFSVSLQTHVIFTQLLHQVDSMGRAAGTVAAVLQAEHTTPGSMTGLTTAVATPGTAVGAAATPNMAGAGVTGAGLMVEGGGAAAAGGGSGGFADTFGAVSGAEGASAATAAVNSSGGGGGVSSSGGDGSGAGMSPGGVAGTPGVNQGVQGSRRADARRQAFVSAALERCKQRLSGMSVLAVDHIDHSSSSGPLGVGNDSGGDGLAGVQSAGGKRPGDGDEVAGVVSVADQVDMVIAAATSLENLSSMYEGWTPWL